MIENEENLNRRREDRKERFSSPPPAEKHHPFAGFATSVQTLLLGSGLWWLRKDR
jgi:hypothetical protein